MAVTLQQIAEAAGVSRGTVDRALNNRGRINAEVADRIRRIADEMGYQPNRAGRALAMAKRSITIGVLIQAANTPFMANVIEGAEDARAEVERLGAKVIIRKMEDFDAGRAVEAMHELKKAGCNGIALVPVDDERLKETVNEFADENIPVITFNSDIEGSGRLCFVGQDTWQSGRVAAGLMADILPADGKVLVISGYPKSYGHKNRTNGFLKEFADLRDDIQVLDVQYDFDDDQMAEMITKGMLREYEDLTGIYLAASGVEGVCKALEEQGMSDQVKVISNDLTVRNVRYLEEGKIRFLIGQDGYRQGYEPVMLLFEKLFDGKEPEKEFAYTEIVIKTRYNLA
ncbi:MAG: LacI family DNA-binding transcriptional regulator [Lachnospiraceae bacterium]